MAVRRTYAGVKVKAWMMTCAPSPCRGAWPLLSQKLMSASEAPSGGVSGPAYVHVVGAAPGAENDTPVAVHVNESVAGSDGP